MSQRTKMSKSDIRSFFNKRKRSESPEFFQPPKKHDGEEDIIEVPSYELQPHSELIEDIPTPFIDRTNNFRRNENLPDKHFSSESSEEDEEGNQKSKKCQNDHEHHPSSEGEVTFNLAKSNYPSKEFSEESDGSEDPNANEAPKEEAHDLKTDKKDKKSVKNAKSEDEEEYDVEFILDYQWCKERVSLKAASELLV